MTNPLPGTQGADLDTRQKTAQLMFDTVIKANEHQDNKANRIISAIAFLLAAGSTILGFSLPTSSGRIVNTFFGNTYLFGVHPALFSYAIFVVLIVIGVSFYLTALGPSFNWPKQGSRRQLVTTPDGVGSLLFFKSVASYDDSALLGFLRGRTNDELKERLIENFVSESGLIAEKLNAKVQFMSTGSLLFRFAIPWIIPLVLSNFSTDRTLTSITYMLALVISILFIEISEAKPYQRNKGSRPWILYGFIVLIAIAAALFEIARNTPA